jgi:hypothetical protein
MWGSNTDAGTSTTASAGATGVEVVSCTGTAAAAGILILPEAGAALLNPANDKRWVTRLRARSNNGLEPGGRGAIGIGPAACALGAGVVAPGGGVEPGTRTFGSGAPGGGGALGSRTVGTGAAGAGAASAFFLKRKKLKKPEAMWVNLGAWR